MILIIATLIKCGNLGGKGDPEKTLKANQPQREDIAGSDAFVVWFLKKNSGPFRLPQTLSSGKR